MLYIASPHRSWMLDSGVSSHMTCIKDKFTSLHLATQFSSINIIDGTQSLVLGDGAVQATPSLNLKNVICFKVSCKLVIYQLVYQTT